MARLKLLLVFDARHPFTLKNLIAMHLKLRSYRAGAFGYYPIIPSSLTGYLLPGSSSWAAGWPYGELMVQEWDCESRIRYSIYLFRETDALQLEEEHPPPFLHFILQNDFLGCWRALGSREDRQWSCNAGVKAMQILIYTLRQFVDEPYRWHRKNQFQSN
jgi:hypothetical protein